MNTTNAETNDSEKEYDASLFPRPSVTVDIALFTVREKSLQVLLIRRKDWPFAGQWALPGGFVRPAETLEDAARRELAEETGVKEVFLEQLRTFGDPGRDPRTWVITVAYTALVSSDRLVLYADTDAAEADWFAADAIPSPLAFDHAVIVDYALAALRARLEANLQIAAALLPKRFTLTQLQQVYETISSRIVDKRNFRKWVFSTDCLLQTTEEQRGAHRPALLYEFIENPAKFPI
ncbi:MAG: NUDIX hydrolase [Janthinobacterium lividum]